MIQVREFVFFIFVGYFTSEGMSSNADINTFFPQIHGNLTRVTWAHAVNDQSYLESVLADDTIMMIEADISIGKMKGSDTEIPIMAHPPINTSDLSLENFLKQVNDSNIKEGKIKGIKLDFKSIEAFIASLTYIADVNQKKFPLWINADILSGPGNSNITPVNSSQLLTNAKNHFPDTVLSLGWITADVPSEYTTDDIKSMIDVITTNSITNVITFPVRASLTANSGNQLKTLLQGFENSTLTIWSSSGDNVDVEKLRTVIFDIGIDKIFIDVPKDLQEKLHLDSPNLATTTKSLSVLGLVLCILIVVI